MDEVKDITSLEAFNNYKKACDNLEQFRREREQRERNISKLFDRYKAKMQESEMANSFGEAEKLENEAEALKAQAKQEQDGLEQWKAHAPHYGNLKGKARQKLVEDGRPFIQNLQEQAREKIEEARAILTAIYESKNKFARDEVNFIPSVTHKLEDLKKIEQKF